MEGNPKTTVEKLAAASGLSPETVRQIGVPGVELILTVQRIESQRSVEPNQPAVSTKGQSSPTILT